ncbi:DUF421 domain-containing protein [Microbacterium aerolatum]|uniref:DUF421 domain-containing protein n=1 Tax=Microbacterium aerolatum TaxID=153731 RepID=UPI003850023D
MPGRTILFTTETPVLELLLRGTVLFFALLVLMRFVGQRESGGLGMSDLLVIVLVCSALGDALTGGGTNLLDGLVPVATVLVWSVILDALTYRWPRLAVLLKRKPRPLVIDGRLDRRTMRREFITEDELLTQLRAHGLSEVSQVQRAHLEPNGEISVIPKDGEGDGTS